MSSRPNPLTPSPSNLSHTLTSTHTHYLHISPHRHLPHCIQAGAGYPTAQKTYIKHFSYRKLQTCLSTSIHSQNTRMSCLQPGLIVSFTEQQTSSFTVAKQSGFRSGHSTETEALQIAKADSKSSVLILLDLSAADLSSSSPHTLHHWVPSYRHMASPTISTLMTHSSISHFDQMIQAARISGCLADISAWMKEHHLPRPLKSAASHSGATHGGFHRSGRGCHMVPSP